jgi:transcriptional regulator with PAS, ATPase and Fis domain
MTNEPNDMIDVELPRLSDRALTDDDQFLFTIGHHSDLSLLILGESGVGKSHLAKLIHEGSPRAKGPFVVADCGAMTESLFESELFGHRRGAFTGAVQSSEGLVARAEGGTLFLDEIGNLPLTCQAKILRLLEERKYRPVGESSERTANVRVIAATNLDVEAALAQGTMRSDLFYRLTPARPIRVRPLRERPASLRELAGLLVAARCRREDHLEPLDDQVLDWTAAQPWPGNVRQLKGVVEVALELARVRWMAEGEACTKRVLLQDFLRASGIPPVRPVEGVRASQAAPVPVRVVEAAGRPMPGEARHRAWVVEILESVKHNQSRAAAIAGVSRRTMINWIERYDLPRPRATNDEAPASRRRLA